MNADIKQQFNEFLLHELNPLQQKIVRQHHGVLLVCAGAGSGKTRIITARMASLILEHGAPPSSIVALTFTNKAAREMKERMIKFLGSSYTLPYVGTFHSYCLRLLKTHNHLVRIKDFSLIDDADQEKLLKTILARTQLHKKITPKQIANLVSMLKNEAITGELPWHLIPDPFMRSLVETYEREKTLSRCLDFDDLLLETLRLIHQNPSFKEEYQRHIRHFLVDEYQDTNKVQHALLQAFTCHTPRHFALDSLCVVGDEDQSIYSWRGATVRNIIYFKTDFPTVEMHTVDRNYRSVQPILKLANEIIAYNKERNPKKLWSDKIAHDRIRLLRCISGYQEADCVVSYAQSYQSAFPHHSIAFLYRSHYQSRILEEALIRQGIPYRIIGGIQFYERQEIKDLLAYLRLLINPYDRISLMRIYAVPSRGLGEKFLEQFFAAWDNQPFLTWIGLAQVLLEQQVITGLKARALQQFITLFTECDLHAHPSAILDYVIKRINYIKYLEESFDKEEAQVKIENIKELCAAVRAAEDRSAYTTLASFLDEIALLQEMSTTKSAEECVQLMTMHAAKGLEFDAVCITGLEDQVLPSSHALINGDLEEERRLLYVGITRTRERLLLSHARYRHLYGNVAEHKLSRFMQEVIEHIIDHDATAWGLSQSKQFALQWLSNVTKIEKKVTAAPPPKKPLEEDPFQDEKPAWHINQRVNHATFGMGVIEKVEFKSTEQTYLTIRFNRERKRIDARYIQS